MTALSNSLSFWGTGFTTRVMSSALTRSVLVICLLSFTLLIYTLFSCLDTCFFFRILFKMFGLTSLTPHVQWFSLPPISPHGCEVAFTSQSGACLWSSFTVRCHCLRRRPLPLLKPPPPLCSSTGRRCCVKAHQRVRKRH